LQHSLHDNASSPLITVHFSEDDKVSSACSLDPVDVGDDWVYLIKFDEHVDIIVDKIRLEIYDFDSSVFEMRLMANNIRDMLFVAAFNKHYHE
jgi:hypothetical protein